MSLRTLLTHRAGFTHEAPVGNNYIPDSTIFDAHIQSIRRTWLRYPVGERYSYSNLGFDLAGFILQRESGISYLRCEPGSRRRPPGGLRRGSGADSDHPLRRRKKTDRRPRPLYAVPPEPRAHWDEPVAQ
jgi:hypothetical protein